MDKLFPSCLLFFDHILLHKFIFRVFIFHFVTKMF